MFEYGARLVANVPAPVIIAQQLFQDIGQCSGRFRGSDGGKLHDRTLLKKWSTIDEKLTCCAR